MSKPSASKRRTYGFCVVVAAVAVALLVFSPGHFSPVRPAALNSALSSLVPFAPNKVPAGSRERLQAAYAALPLAFERNQGQVDPQVKYLARASGYTLFLTKDDAVFSFHSKAAASELTARGRLHAVHSERSSNTNEASAAVVRMRIARGNSAAQIAAVNPLPGKTNYYLGNDPKKWQTNVSQYARVAYRNVYPGIDLAYYGEQSKLEFDFIVAPESDPAVIEVGFSGAQRVATDGSGNLVVSSAAGDVVLHKPLAYQLQGGSRQPVEARFVLKGGHQVSFDLGTYDHSRELVIDPTVTYATYLGGTAEDDGNGIAFDSSGAAYVTGQTQSTNFPAVGGVAPNAHAGGFDVFVSKISADGSTLVYSTYVGGSGDDSGNAIAVDSSGDSFVAGGTTSSNFPTVVPFQKTFGGGTDAFVFELNPSGTALTYSTYLGGTGTDFAVGLTVDGSENAYIVGSTGSTDFPTLNPIQKQLNGATNGFVTKLNASGSALVYSTWLGGGTGDFASAVAVDSSNNAYVTGGTSNSTFPHTSGAFQTTCGSCSGALSNAFATVVNASGSGYVYSTFLGGDTSDEGLGIAVDSSGDAYVTGSATSSNFPLKSALYSTYGGSGDAFVSELNPGGTALIYSTFLGGSLNDTGTSIAVDGSNHAYVTGQTGSSNFPTMNPTQGALKGDNDAFVTEINSAGSSLLFSTYLGGSLNENTQSAGVGALGAIAVDGPGANIYVTGNTASTADFPATTSAFQKTTGGGTDAFVVKYTQQGSAQSFALAATALTPASVNAGSSATSTVTVSSATGFTGTVTISCAVSPAVTLGPTCGAATATSAASATLTVSSTAAAALLRHPRRGGPSGLLYALLLPGGIILTGFSLNAHRKKLFGYLVLGLLLISLALVPACGGGSSSGGGGGGSTGTPAGEYTITVTGTASGATQTGANPSLTLTVN